ncbi:MAG: hypothetical protein UY23_C0006G0025 [Candidatus Jorgensenbacteria bacterium GW2011_GWA1_48_11]|uniref:Uncharacterized protein n=1 Tax=Candidatus Jorgensenbacteria bacterium GW2011_GWA1_48_11 TaxID=1618660 RepID=A0A0G1U9K0_9BACT|nr:MAG: hypothetical protein UY23_C0006G0025 [Candidatus Jorgensenbacteria bacterium GW2011_GWA1_48_11]
MNRKMNGLLEAAIVLAGAVLGFGLWLLSRFVPFEDVAAPERKKKETVRPAESRKKEEEVPLGIGA